jgi:hypothetical protein
MMGALSVLKSLGDQINATGPSGASLQALPKIAMAVYPCGAELIWRLARRLFQGNSKIGLLGSNPNADVAITGRGCPADRHQSANTDALDLGRQTHLLCARRRSTALCGPGRRPKAAGDAAPGVTLTPGQMHIRRSFQPACARPGLADLQLASGPNH